MTEHDQDERFRLEMWKDTVDAVASLPVVPFNVTYFTPPDLEVQLGDERIHLPALFRTLEEAETEARRISLPDGCLWFITEGSWGPGASFEEMEEEGLDVLDVLDLCEWDVYRVVRVITKEA